MLPRFTALLAAAAVAAGLSACGDGGEDLSDVIPRSTPELTSPLDTVLGRPEYTKAATGPTTPAAASASAAPAPPAAPSATARAAVPALPSSAAPPAPSSRTASSAGVPGSAPARSGAGPAPAAGTTTGASAPPTPKTAPPLTPQPVHPDAGGSSPGAFSEFCRENPGACPG